MYVKLQVPFIILIFLNTIYCFKNSNELLQLYLKETKRSNGQLNELNAYLCKEAETDLLTRLKTCQRVIKLLRDDPEGSNPFRHSLYMNYKVFTSSLKQLYPVCMMKLIKIGTVILGVHMTMNCYGRFAIASKNDAYLTEVSIFHGLEDSIVVLKCSGSVSCEIIEWYHKNEGSENSSFSLNTNNLNMIFNIPVPWTAEIEQLSSVFKNNQNDIWKMSVNPDHYINNKNMPPHLFNTICSAMLDRPEYRRKCKSTTIVDELQKKSYKLSLTVYDPFVTNQQLRESRLHISIKLLMKINVYPCQNHILKGCSYPRTFKIMAGPDQTSLIIIKPSTCYGEPCFVPAELVENATLDYFIYLEYYF